MRATRALPILGRMDKEALQFDRIVGLIYDATQDGQGPDSVFDEISSEIAAMGAQVEPSHSFGLFLRTYLDTPKSRLEQAMDISGSSNPLPPAAQQLLLRLAPHLQRSSRLHERLRQLEQQQAIRHMELAHLPFGLVWIGSQRQAFATNKMAAEMLQAEAGLSLHDGYLQAWLQTDTEHLNAALHTALRKKDRKGHLIAIRRRHQTLPLLVSVIPATAPPDASGKAAESQYALVILQNPNESAIGLEHLQLVYGFTEAERALAEALINNETLESFSARASVTRNTLRSHLSRLFFKTGTSRQAELVRLLMLARPRT